MAETSDREYLSLGLELAARLRDMALNVEGDAKYIEEGGTLLYCIDPQIMDVLVDPIHNLIDVDVFGRRSEDSRKSEEFLGERREGTLLSIARLFYLLLIGDGRASEFPEKILLNPIYDNELRAAILHHKHESHSTGSGNANRASDSMRASLSNIAKAIEAHRQQKASILATYIVILQNMSREVLYALAPEEDTPLARFRTMLSRGLLDTEREVLSKIKSPQEIRELALYDRCVEQLFLEKRHVTELKNPRSAGELRLAVTSDAQAIVAVILLNEYFQKSGLRRRAIFLTADSTIQKLFSSNQSRARILNNNQSDNFVRSPLEMPALFAAKMSGRKNGGLLKRIAYFDYFLEDGAKTAHGGDYRSYLNEVRFHELPVHLPDSGPLTDLPIRIIRGVEFELRDVLRTFEGEIARRAMPNLENYIKTVEGRLAQHDITEILDQSWEASDAISDGLSQLLGVSFLYVTSRHNLIWVLNSSFALSGASSASGARISRFPFMNLSERQTNYFRALLNQTGERTAAETLFDGLSAAERGELTLANAFLYGVGGDWRKAERLALAAIELDAARPKKRHRGEYPLRDEAIFFRAVSARHSPLPSLARWKDAANALKKLVERNLKRVDLRYLVEYAVLGVAVPYRAHHDARNYLEVFHPKPQDALAILRDAGERFERKNGKLQDELSARLGTQIYFNLCLLFIHSRMIEPKVKLSISAAEAEEYLNSLSKIIERTKSWHPVSPFVSVVQKAVSLELSELGASERLSAFKTFLFELGQRTDVEYGEHDRKRIDDLRSYFESRVKAH
jgi:hypothetical protein